MSLPADRLRIAYLHQYYNTPAGQPGSTRSYEFAKRMVQRGHEVDIITTAYKRSDSASPGGWQVPHRRRHTCSQTVGTLQRQNAVLETDSRICAICDLGGHPTPIYKGGS